MYKYLSYLLAVMVLSFSLTVALVDSPRPSLRLKHATVARKLVNQASWAAVGTISTNTQIKDYPMVNIISVNDKNLQHRSTGRIQFLLTDLDYTGRDLKSKNRATFVFSDEQLQRCSQHKPHAIDAMEPLCARVIISGKIKKLKPNDRKYEHSLRAFIKRHPTAKKWLRVHTFYLCELKIKNIIVSYTHGGPLSVKISDYYKVKL